MNSRSGIQQRRRQILEELAYLDQIRRGSVTEQFVDVTGQDGRRHRRGP